jgi:hypothetical protein
VGRKEKKAGSKGHEKLSYLAGSRERKKRVFAVCARENTRHTTVCHMLSAGHTTNRYHSNGSVRPWLAWPHVAKDYRVAPLCRVLFMVFAMSTCLPCVFSSFYHVSMFAVCFLHRLPCVCSLLCALSSVCVCRVPCPGDTQQTTMYTSLLRFPVVTDIFSCHQMIF